MPFFFSFFKFSERWRTRCPVRSWERSNSQRLNEERETERLCWTSIDESAGPLAQVPAAIRIPTRQVTFHFSIFSFYLNTPHLWISDLVLLLVNYIFALHVSWMTRPIVCSDEIQALSGIGTFMNRILNNFVVVNDNFYLNL